MALEDRTDSACMAVVPWTYNNPRIDRKSQPVQRYTLNGKLIEILQDTSADINVNQNTGLKLWDGAFILAKCLEDECLFPPGFFKGKRCIELGAGCGLVGIAAWLQGGTVTLTDMEDMIEHTRKCVIHNAEKLKGKISDDILHNEIKSEVLMWGSNCSDLDPPFDIIFGSDIIYHKDYMDDLIQTMDALSGPHSVIYISYKARGLGEEIFFHKMKKAFFELTKIPRENHPKECQGTEYELLCIRKKTNQ